MVLFHQLPAHVRSIARRLIAPCNKRQQYERDLSSCSCCFWRGSLWWPDVFRGYVVHTTSHAPIFPGEKQKTDVVQTIYRRIFKIVCRCVGARQFRSFHTSLVNVYALIGRMRVLSSDAVIEGAEAVARKIIDTYFSPNRTFPELRELMNSRAMDPLREFSEACRNELRALKPS